MIQMDSYGVIIALVVRRGQKGMMGRFVNHLHDRYR